MKMFPRKANNLFLIFSLLSTAVITPSISGCDACGAIEKFDVLVSKDETCQQKWSDYESQLQRRSDMIPQLVSVVKGSAAHEQETLSAVVQARANATRPEIHLDPKSDDFSNPEKIKAFQQAQAQLGTALGKLMMIQESYPDLKANQAFHDLQITIEGTENRIGRSREEYNKSVQGYNLELRRVGGRAINSLTGKEFKVREYFKMDPEAGKAPTIDFSKGDKK